MAQTMANTVQTCRKSKVKFSWEIPYTKQSIPFAKFHELKSIRLQINRIWLFITSGADEIFTGGQLNKRLSECFEFNIGSSFSPNFRPSPWHWGKSSPGHFHCCEAMRRSFRCKSQWHWLKTNSVFRNAMRTTQREKRTAMVYDACV